MSSKSSMSPILLFVWIFAATLNPAAAANFSFAGGFTADDGAQAFAFTVGATSTVTLRTWSYAGGINAAGATIAEGGFDPILALFNSSGTLIGQNDDGGCSLVAASFVTGSCWDTYFQAVLAPGNYTVAISQYDNFAIGPNIANGYARSGQPFFTGVLGGCSNGQFCDVTGANRTSNWAFDVLNVQQAATIPVPAAVWLFGSALSLIAAMRRKISS